MRRGLSGPHGRELGAARVHPALCGRLRGLITLKSLDGPRGGEKPVEFWLVEELNPGLGALDDRAVGQFDRIAHAPAHARTELEQRVHRIEMVADSLRSERVELACDVAFDVAWLDRRKVLAGRRRLSSTATNHERRDDNPGNGHPQTVLFSKFRLGG